MARPEFSYLFLQPRRLAPTVGEGEVSMDSILQNVDDKYLRGCNLVIYGDTAEQASLQHAPLIAIGKSSLISTVSCNH